MEIFTKCYNPSFHTANIDKSFNILKLWGDYIVILKEKYDYLNFYYCKSLGQVDKNERNLQIVLSAKQKRALETVSVQKDEHHQTVISSAFGTKILKNLDNLQSECVVFDFLVGIALPICLRIEIHFSKRIIQCGST